MKHLLIYGLLHLGTGQACKTAATTPVVAPTTPVSVTAPATYSFGATPVWRDEFNYTGPPDSTRWSYDLGGSGWGNNEAEYYTKSLKNARVDGENLSIEAIRENVGGKNYTSARLVTKQKGDWLYGRFEIRAKLPQGTGTWPAIWMLATEQTHGTQYWPDNGEIDIMEHVGFDPTVVHGTIHTKAFNHSIHTEKGNSRTVPTAMTDFHTYALEWYPDRVKWFIDDVVYYEIVKQTSWSWSQWPFDHKFHLLLNVAIGGNWGGRKGIDDSIFPQKMVVDYVRVYPLKTN